MKKSKPEKTIFDKLVTDKETAIILNETVNALKQSNEALKELKSKIYPPPHGNPIIDKAIERNEIILKLLPK